MRTPRLALAMMFAAATTVLSADEWSDRFDAIATNRVSMSESARLHLFFDTDWDWRMAKQIPEDAIDSPLLRAFKTLPRTTYGVIAIPEYSEKSQTTAYYQRGSVQASRPGCYFVNTYALHTRPKWEMEALSLHEAVPGHHLQIALAQEKARVAARKAG